MNLDDIKRMIQNFFQSGTVTIVGSGLSLAEGIPGMQDLAIELQGKLPGLLSAIEDVNIWGKIDADLTKGIGLEEALHNTKPSPFVEECIRKVTAMYVGEADRKVFYDVIQNGKLLRFSEYLQKFNVGNQGMTVITTNYDRLIEYACEGNAIMVDTLFVGKYISRFKPEESKYASCMGMCMRNGKIVSPQYAPRVTVLKPHGCLSWHLLKGMPYSIANYPVEDSLIITPGLNKYREGYSSPFDIHRSKANSEIDKAQRYIIIGYGFGDDHLEIHLMQQLHSGKAALILTHSLSAKAEQVVKSCKNVIAICCENSVDSRVITSDGEVTITGINLWDLHEMIKEVF